MKAIALTRLDPEDFTGCLSLPVASLLQRPVKFDRSRHRTFVYTSTTVPAFVGMQYDRGFAFLSIGNIDVYRTYFNASIASITFFGIENYRSAWRNHIRKSIYFFFCHGKPPFYLL